MVSRNQALAIGMAMFHGNALGAMYCAATQTRRCLTHTAKLTARAFVEQCVHHSSQFMPRFFALLDTPVYQHPSGIWLRKSR
jgi:hypothetical protein